MVDTVGSSALRYNSHLGQLGAWNFDSYGNVSGSPTLSWTCDDASGCSAAWKPIGRVTYNDATCGTASCTGLLWYNKTTGELSRWNLSGSTVTGATSLSRGCGPSDACSTRWTPLLVADANGDGNSDILWHNRSSGELSFWLVNGSLVMGDQKLSWNCPTRTGCADHWEAIGAADVNHDGKVDLTWRDDVAGTISSWLLDGNGKVTGTSALSWTCNSECGGSWKALGYVDRAFADVGPTTPPVGPNGKPRGGCEAGTHGVRVFDTDTKKWGFECVLDTLKCPFKTKQDGTWCSPCGGNGQQACDQGCDPKMEASTGVCLPCGADGQPSCTGLVAGCDGGAELAQGRCRACGGVGQPTCTTRALCNPGIEAWNGSCRTPVSRVPEPQEGCGGLSESCCRNPIYQRPCTDPKLICGKDGWWIFGPDDVCIEPPKPPKPYNPGGGGGGGGSTYTTICKGTPIPSGYLIVNDSWDPTTCGKPSTNTTYNVQTIMKVSDYPLGAALRVCAGQTIPGNWKIVSTLWDGTSCGYPSMEVDNVAIVARQN